MVKDAQATDSQLWLTAGTYLDYLTDNRLATYRRSYIGQSVALAGRLEAHRRMFTARNRSTLHYFIFALASNHRQPNFIRLSSWTRPCMSDLDHRRRTLILSITELALGLAFRALPITQQEEWLPLEYKGFVSESLGLMVACPMDQWSASSHQKRKSLRSTLLTSKDPEIRSWPEERDKQWQKTKRQHATSRRLLGSV